MNYLIFSKYVYMYTHIFIYKATQIAKIPRDTFIYLPNTQEISSTY